ncbi:uncharacterized protein si:ch211-126c2.4 isoform X1 [Astyanax mexicanus]|uniref:uncharacterized protein si:ch211-126c2.4 isoform X1 n=1 Tax=Astyanax mexicanus TaxID=7994 RepID=UPI0020CB176C|nr:uncharacterized protein si:ch211-126c2.4 isoform X1 [Astyanax mexicanus]
MESVHRDRCEDGGSRLGVSTIQKQMSTSQFLISQSPCPKSPLHKIGDESFPYMSGIFDDTIDPSFTSDHPDRSQFKTLKGQADVISGLRSQNKAAYNCLVSGKIESVHGEKCEEGDSRLGVSTIQRQMSTSQLLISQSLCPNSPLHKISDETFPYMSGIFDDTIDLTADQPDRSQFKNLKGQADVISGLRSQNKAAYNGLVSTPMEHCHSIDFSMSVTSPPDNHVSDVIETNPVEATQDISSHLPEPAKCSQSLGLNSSNDSNESPGLNATKDTNENPVWNSVRHFTKTSGLNATKDLQGNPGLNATKDQESPGLNAAKGQESPGLNATKDQESPGLNATKDQESPGLNATKDQESPELDATKARENPGLNATNDLDENPGLNFAKDLTENPGTNSTKVNENPGLNYTKDLDENSRLNCTKSLEKSPGLNSTKDLSENPVLNSTKDLSGNPGLNSTKDLCEKSGMNSTISDPCEGAKSNTTFEKSPGQGGRSTPGSSSSVSAVDGTLEVVNEKHLNSTVDVCGPANTTTEQPSEKPDCSADIGPSQTSVPKKLRSSEGLASGEDCEKHGTFTKPTEETRGELTVDVEQSVRAASLHVSPESGETRSANSHPVDGTFIKHDVTTDVTTDVLPVEPHPSLKNAKVNTTVNVTKPSDAAEIQAPSDTNANVDADAEGTDAGGCGVAVTPTPTPEPSEQCCANTVPVDVPLNSEVPVCSNRTPGFPEAVDEAEEKEEEPQESRRRKNGFYEQDSCLSLDISHSSIFSLDDPLERTSRVLITSTPIVLGRGFDRLRCAKPMEMQKRLSVINSIDAHSNNDLAGVSGSDATATNPSSIKSETCSETQKSSAKCTTTNSSTSESAVAIKPPKMTLRRRIPQPGNFAGKSGIPSKSQIPARPPTLQGASSVVGKAKTVPAAPSAAAPSQPETSSSALHGVKRTVQLNKGKKLAPVKTITTTTAKNIKTSYVAASTSACTSTTGTKPSQTMAPPKSSELQPPGRGRFGLKPPGIAVFSAEASHPQTHNKPTGLPGMRTRSSLLPAFAQKHASSEALPLAKRKRTDVQDQLSSAEPTSSKPDEGAQGRVPKNIKPKKASQNCNTCTVLKEKLNTFHQEIGAFIQELEKRPAGCNSSANWLPFQSKFETCLQEFKRLHSEHQ